MAERPSFLQVDRWVLTRDRDALGALGEDWHPHVAEVQRELPVPDWVHELAEAGDAEGAENPRRRRPWWLGLGLVAAVVVALLVVVPDSYVGPKGGLDVVVYLQDGPWDGAPLEPGVPLRLVMHGRATPFYAVLFEEAGTLTVVSEGRWPAGGEVPGAWAFDAPPAPGAALVVLALQEDPSGRPAGDLEAEAVHVHREPLGR